MTRRSNTKICCMLLAAAMALMSAGTANAGWCGCEHPFEDWEMPAISVPGSSSTCCDHCEPDHECCNTVEHQGDEPRIDGSLPQQRLDDDAAPAMQSPSGSILRVADGQHRRVEPSFTVDRLPPHICTTVLLI